MTQVKGHFYSAYKNLFQDRLLKRLFLSTEFLYIIYICLYILIYLYKYNLPYLYQKSTIYIYICVHILGHFRLSIDLFFYLVPAAYSIVYCSFTKMFKIKEYKSFNFILHYELYFLYLSLQFFDEF